MSIQFQDGTIRLEGDCYVEDAETLYGHLLNSPGAVVDLGACGRIHAAVLQVLVVMQPMVCGMPSDSKLARWIDALLATSDEPSA